MSSTLDVARLVEGLREHTAALARAVTGQPPATRVPTCPDWPLRTLVGHVGQEHRWAAEIVRGGEQLPAPDPQLADPGTPDAWAGWLHKGAEQLIHAIGEVGGDAEIRTFLGPRSAAFVLRRMVSDTCVHHYDAAGASFAIAEDLAADVISETLDLLATPGLEAVRPGLAELPGAGERIGFRPAEGAGWLVTRAPGAVRWERGPVEADVVVSGPVAQLMLVLTRRIPPEDAQVTGERALLDHWLARTAL
ncbi:maleylpyruvate isomerase family mycothiol-dependent enzyme [Streptomyces sp. NRRL WC-3742]|uniref:maleylpyruvate isomerase family mycothiol-dependent enzyme n=1 Tax=Streptomyces sp. NRRL WC-3742 TaxID=1463934 RepID=UPI0004CAD184|nr:maleylpyruvate isomerase family mycothiol-dependent enzyme [Streptomyces sp. NRRL WC-3742]